MGWLERTVILLGSMIILVAGSLAFLASPMAVEAGPTGAVVWTKAICDDGNFCVDYEVTCQDGLVVHLEKTAFSAQYESDWVDPRSPELKNGWC
jgi:hypothetical protein